MSAPAPEFPEAAASTPTFSFGGYATESAGLAGVSFWPRVGARLIDLGVHYCVSFAAGVFFTILLGTDLIQRSISNSDNMSCAKDSSQCRQSLAVCRPTCPRLLELFPHTQHSIRLLDLRSAYSSGCRTRIVPLIAFRYALSKSRIDQIEVVRPLAIAGVILTAVFTLTKLYQATQSAKHAL